MFSLINLSKMSVLSVLDSKNDIKQVKNNVFVQQVAFLVRILVRKRKKTEKVPKKALVFIVKMFTVIVFEDYFFKNLQRERFF